MSMEDIRRRPFVVFADDFGRHPSSAQHLFNHFPRKDLIWVNTVGLRRPKLSASDFRRARSILERWARRIGTDSEKDIFRDSQGSVHVVSPTMSPGPPVGLHRIFNRWSLRRGILRSLREAGLSRPVVLTTLPSTADLVGELGECLHVYYCVDDYTRWPGGYGRPLRDREEELLGKVDAVIATSQALLNTRQPASGQSFYLPHGVDIEHFRKARLAGPEHPAVEGIEHPRIGYLGLLDGRHDAHLWEQMVTALPNHQFVLVGPRQIRIPGIEDLPNVHLRDAVPYAELPDVMRGLDAAVLPYLKTGAGASINPLKAKEILAAGLPLVSTPLPELQSWAAPIALVDDAAGFVQAIEELLHRGKESSWPAIEDFLTGESWEEKAGLLAATLSQWLEQKENCIG